MQAGGHRDALVNVSITGTQGPCNDSRPVWSHGVWPPQWCSELKTLPVLDGLSGVSMSEQAAMYKYIIVIDGWASADRLLPLLKSGSVLLLPGPVERNGSRIEHA